MPITLALRARTILACAQGKENQQVAEELKVGQDTVAKWRRRFVEYRLEGLRDAHRSDQEHSIAAFLNDIRNPDRAGRATPHRAQQFPPASAIRRARSRSRAAWAPRPSPSATRANNS